MPLALTLSDNGDGTATATLSGTGGAAVALSSAPPDPPFAWTPAGGITGDGAVVLALGRGVWWVYADGGTAGRTVPQVVGVTDGTLAPATVCRNAVAARIKLLGLPGIGNNVHAKAYSADDTDISYPAVFCAIDGGRETQPMATSSQDFYGHPVSVVIADRADALLDPSVPQQIELWRYRVMQAFSKQALPGSAAIRCNVEPGVILQREEHGPDGGTRYLYATSGMVIRCVTPAGRGLGA